MASRFFHGYYVCNFLLIIAYILLRVQHLHPGELGELDILGLPREASIYFCVFLMLFVRILSAPTMDAYLATSFKVIFVSISLCLWFMDVQVLCIFCLLHAAIFVFCPQPRFRYPDSIRTLNHSSLETSVTKNSHRTFTVLWAHATWAPRCTQLAPVFANLAAMISHPRVQFSKIDVGRRPAAAPSIGVNVAATSNELPCAILYRRGKEVVRFPPSVEGGGIDKRWRNGFTAKILWKELGMDGVCKEAREWEEAAKKKLQNQEGKKVL